METSEYDGELKGETPKKKLIDFGLKSGPIWVPVGKIKSETPSSAYSKNKLISYELPVVFAIENGLE